MKKRIYILEGILQMFIGVGAVICGFLLIIEPSGKLIQLPIELLSNSPFENYLIPGLILFLVNGIGNVFGSILSFTKNRYSGYAGVFFGSALIIWIMVQVIMIGLSSLLQPFYLILGFLEILGAIKIHTVQKEL